MSAHVNEGAREEIETATLSVTHHWDNGLGGTTVTFTGEWPAQALWKFKAGQLGSLTAEFQAVSAHLRQLPVSLFIIFAGSS